METMLAKALRGGVQNLLAAGGGARVVGLVRRWGRDLHAVLMRRSGPLAMNGRVGLMS
jgi:hypothetical protein